MEPRSGPPPGAPVAVDLTRFLPMFFQETEEHLAAMEGHLLRLDPHAPDPEALHSIFRAAHSVKGNSAIFGATRFSEIMHRVESILDRMRKADLAPTNAVISLLLEACDGVREELRCLKDTGNTDPTALQAVYERLSQLSDAALPSTVEASGTPAPRRSERLRIEVHLARGEGITALPLAGLYAELGTLGRVEDLQAGDGSQGMPALSLFLLTPESAEAVRARLGALLGVENVRVERHERAPPSQAASPPALTTAEAAAFGVFAPEQTTAGSGSAFERTGVFPARARGRRLADQDTSQTSFGRRASDRTGFDRSSIRVDVAKVDRLLNLVGELVIAQSMLAEAAQRSSAAGDAKLRGSVAYVGRQTRELQEAVMSIRLLPIDFLFSRMPRMVRDLAQRLGKEVELAIQGGEAELDKEMIEKLADPVMHLMRNSLDHGIEPPELREAAGKPRQGTIQLRALHHGGAIVVEIEDDGAGFDRDKILRKAEERGLRAHAGMSDEEVWQLVFAPGFTTADTVSDVSGRGVGMDVVERNIGALGGRIDIDSRRGAGTTITVALPLTLAILDGMTVAIGPETFIIPLSSISEAFQPQPGQVRSIAGGSHVIELRDSYVPLLPLESLLHLRGHAARPEESIAVVVEADGRRAALAVDKLLGQQQVVIKSLEANYKRVCGIAGATVLGNGRVALILDVTSLLRGGLAPAKDFEDIEAEVDPV
jgi:two-component system, chemotaxis family, sensor kinase CheA